MSIFDEDLMDKAIVREASKRLVGQKYRTSNGIDGIILSVDSEGRPNKICRLYRDCTGLYDPYINNLKANYSDSVDSYKWTRITSLDEALNIEQSWRIEDSREELEVLTRLLNNIKSFEGYTCKEITCLIGLIEVYEIPKNYRRYEHNG